MLNVQSIRYLIYILQQWYWSVEYSDYKINMDNSNSINFDAYLIPESDLELGQFRLLDVDNRITVPVNVAKWEIVIMGNLKKLSNSGNTLKLLIPNYSRKAISGWSNYSCMVISQKISEKIMGNRGSKSDFIFKSVKEQRVDGSLWIKSIHLRCTLMGFERNYQAKIPSKLKNKTRFTTLKIKPKTNPWFFNQV